ncbi:MAG: amidohydrolase family protein, partial [Gammaproteobacteria bacterium]|nr:amidohydrolase family protein [Gammaproteobacteria bacterium]
MNRTYRSPLLIGLVLAITGSTAFGAEVTYIKAGSLFDTRSGRVARNAVITIEDDRIRAVGGPDTPIPAGSDVIDLSSSFVMPGLMDMHTHIVGYLERNFFAGYFQSPHRATIGGVVNAEKTLLAGFTTVRNVGAPGYADVALRDAIN